MPFIESNELRKIAVSLGAAIVQIAVTNPVVISTTKTQPGTSPCSSFVNLLKLSLIFPFTARAITKCIRTRFWFIDTSNSPQSPSADCATGEDSWAL